MEEKENSKKLKPQRYGGASGGPGRFLFWRERCECSVSQKEGAGPKKEVTQINRLGGKNPWLGFRATGM